MVRRREQLGKMLEKAKDDLTGHEAGRTLLSDEEYEKLKKKAEILERKLERMMDIDERELDRMHRREERRQARRRSRSREL
mmetsp:Transcript_6937/g.10533  ORF Transcript_6937/g.10533 Transcript_6937/m.10533 type:complete len:81 (+) Transcript_6937:315-557(+)